MTVPTNGCIRSQDSATSSRQLGSSLHGGIVPARIPWSPPVPIGTGAHRPGGRSNVRSRDPATLGSRTRNRMAGTSGALHRRPGTVSVTLSSMASRSFLQGPVPARLASARHASRSASERASLVRSFGVASHGLGRLMVTTITASPTTAISPATLASVRIATAALTPAPTAANAATSTGSPRWLLRPGASLTTTLSAPPAGRIRSTDAARRAAPDSTTIVHPSKIVAISGGPTRARSISGFLARLRASRPLHIGGQARTQRTQQHARRRESNDLRDPLHRTPAWGSRAHQDP
jgi:hypothetical protein